MPPAILHIGGYAAYQQMSQTRSTPPPPLPHHNISPHILYGHASAHHSGQYPQQPGTGTPRLAHWGIPRQINRDLTGGQQRQHGPPPSVSSRLAGALRSSIYYATPSFPLRSHRTATPVFKSPASGSPPCSGTTSPCFHFRWEYTVGMASVGLQSSSSTAYTLGEVL